MGKRFLILLEKNIVNRNSLDYVPSFYVGFSGALKEEMGEFLQNKWASYRPWAYQDHFILLKQIGNVPSGHSPSLNQICGLVDTPDKAEVALKTKAKEYANEMKEKLLLEKGIEAKIFYQVKDGNISVSELVPLKDLEEVSV